MFVEKVIDKMLHCGDTRNLNAKKNHHLNAIFVHINQNKKLQLLII